MPDSLGIHHIEGGRLEAIRGTWSFSKMKKENSNLKLAAFGSTRRHAKAKDDANVKAL